jgi:Holliday junction resolvase
MPAEGNLQKFVIAELKRRRIYYVNVFGAGRTGKGTPDILACINGQFVAMELKVRHNQMQDDQVIRRKQILASGGLHYTPRTKEEVVNILDSLDT